MSLALLALRTVTVKALRGRTLAGDAVHPSAIQPLEGKVRDEPAPFILVFTDSGETKDVERDQIGRDMLGAAIDVTLSFEIAVATRVPVAPIPGEAPDGPVTEIVIPETDEGFEITIDVIARQVCAELQAGDTAWAELWRSMVMRVLGIRSERGQSAENGVRFAARRLGITVDLVADPAPGAPLDGLWADIVAAFDGDAELAPIGALVRAVAEGEPFSDWRHVQAQLGLTGAGVRGIGVAPFRAHNEGPNDPAALLNEVTIDPLGISETAGEPPTWDPPPDDEEGPE